MPEWSTYQLSDFLMFSPRTYWRLVEGYHRAVWPGQLLAVLLGLATLGLAALSRPESWRLLATLLTAAWLWVAWAFLWERYAAINWPAQAIAAAWLLQGLALGACACFVRGTSAPRAWVRFTGWFLAAAGIVLYPLLAVVSGRPLIQSEWAGLMPDPTALATLGLLAAARCGPPGWLRLALSVVPTLSLAFGIATQVAMAA